MSVGLEVIEEARQVGVPAVATSDFELQRAILDGLISLEEYVGAHPYDDEMSHGDVISRIGDMCIDARRTFDQMPASLRLARAHAHAAETEAQKGVRSRGLALIGVVHSFQEALTDAY